MTHLDSLLTTHGGRVEKANGVRSLERRLFGPVREPDPDPLRTLVREIDRPDKSAV